jgi:glutamine synthetase adenylyltransferase
VGLAPEAFIETLVSGYRFLRKLENRLRIKFQTAVTHSIEIIHKVNLMQSFQIFKCIG